MEIPNKLSGNYSYESVPEPYNCLRLHEDMIRDESTHILCKNAILLNKHLFQDKVILDVNCGTALLSMFIASQGARNVIGIEPSEHMAAYARENIERNGLKNVYILQQDVVDIEKLPLDIEKVDIIVSQWQAYLLFDRKLLESLFEARNRWLKSDGFMFPDVITMHITGVSCVRSEKLRYDNFTFAPLSHLMNRVAKVMDNFSGKIATDSVIIRKMNLKKMASTNISFSQKFTLTCSKTYPINAFTLHFEVHFSKGHMFQKISTSPSIGRSHWKPIVLFLETPLAVHPSEQINGSFDMKVDEQVRALFFRLAIDFFGTFCKTDFAREYILR